MYSRSPEGHSLIPHFCAVVLCGLLLLPYGPAQALPDDRDKPIHITADTAVRDEKQGFTVYSGNVQMDQGSMHIEADKLTIYHVNDDADRIVALGRPAKMRQQPELEKGPVHAQANKIEFFKREERVHLQTNARIEQDGAMVTGDSIDYFIAEQLVKADSDQTRDGNRVQVVIPPSGSQESAPPDTGRSTQETGAAEADQQEQAARAETPQPAASAPVENEIVMDEADSGATDSE